MIDSLFNALASRITISHALSPTYKFNFESRLFPLPYLGFAAKDIQFLFQLA